ncbi:MAG: hypothetical protein GY856_15590 [bacterium]|nr:hypothetical protein [bacterium]
MVTLSKHGRAALILGIAAILVRGTAAAQEPPETTDLQAIDLRVIAEAGARKVAEVPEVPEDAFALIDAAGNPVGYERREGSGRERRRYVVLASGNRFPVENLLGTLVSLDARTLLKFGDPVNLLQDRDKAIGWILYSTTGEVLATHRDRDFHSSLAMAKDGHFAIAGPRSDIDQSGRAYLSVYDPTGRETFRRTLAEGRMPTRMALRDRASTIAVCTTTRDDEGGVCDLQLFDDSGQRIATLEQHRYVNQLSFQGADDRYLLAFAIDSLTCADGDDGRVLWTSRAYYRTVGPHALHLSEDGSRLALVTAELSTEADDRYGWLVHVLSMTSGRELGRRDLAGLHPLSRASVVRWEAERRLAVTVDERAITLGYD